MSFASNIKFILNHPLNRKQKSKALIRFIKWQLNSRLNKKPLVYAFTERSKLYIEKGMTGATGNLYCGLHDFNDMGFLLHLLRSEDLFLDIGANIGSYSVLASAHVGAETIAVEPILSTFQKLKNNIALNKILRKVTALNLALGSEIGEVSFTSSLDTMNHISLENEENSVTVALNILDNILPVNTIPILLKIDVEGFETEVLKGAEKTLKNTDLKAIIIELNGSGKRYGYEEELIHNKLIELGFKSFNYNPISRELKLVEKYGALNTIYVRDLIFVNHRLQTAEKLMVLNQEF